MVTADDLVPLSKTAAPTNAGTPGFTNDTSAVAKDATDKSLPAATTDCAGAQSNVAASETEAADVDDVAAEISVPSSESDKNAPSPSAAVAGGAVDDSSPHLDLVVPSSVPSDTRCEAFLITKQNNPKAFFSMLVGVKKPGPDGHLVPICDPENEEPFKSYKGLTKITPTRVDLIEELKRRIDIYDIREAQGNKKHRPSGWNKPRVVENLNKWPIKEDVEIDWLCGKLAEFRTVINNCIHENMLGEGPAEEEPESGPNQWRGHVCYMRLVHCLIDDRIMPKFLERDLPKTREQVDGRNGPDAEPDFWELMKELYNDPTFRPRSMVLPKLHELFNKSYDLFAEHCPETTAQKLKAKFGDSRAMMLQLMANYNVSGAGDGMFNQDGIFCAGDLKDFLGNYPPHLLYFIYVVHEYNLDKSCAGVLPDTMGADGENIPTVVGKRRKRAKMEEDYERKRAKMEEDDLEMKKKESEQREKTGAAITALAAAQTELAKSNKKRAAAEAKRASAEYQAMLTDLHREMVTAKMYYNKAIQNAHTDPSNLHYANEAQFWLDSFNQLACRYATLQGGDTLEVDVPDRAADSAAAVAGADDDGVSADDALTK